MALIKCPECGREKVSDSAEMCPDCSFPIKQYYIKKYEEAKQKAEVEKGQQKGQIRAIKEYEKKRKKTVKIIIPMTVIILLLIVGGFTYINVRDMFKMEIAYREAVNIFETANYEKAMHDFLVLGDYKDSKEYVERCEINIPVKKYNNGFYLQAYKELISVSPDTFDKVMGSSGITLDSILGDCRKQCAELGHREFANKKYFKALDYFEICYEYEDVSYEDEYLFTIALAKMDGFWYYFKPNDTIHDGWFYIGNDEIETLGIESLGVKSGNYEFEKRDASIYIPDLEIYINLLASEECGKIYVEKGGNEYPFYDNQNYMSAEQQTKENAIKEPMIGMTAEEVEVSTWGKPNKINKTTYSWGTTEQWCYPNYKYIYFDNGRVTAISE